MIHGPAGAAGPGGPITSAKSAVHIFVKQIMDLAKAVSSHSDSDGMGSIPASKLEPSKLPVQSHLSGTSGLALL